MPTLADRAATRTALRTVTLADGSTVEAQVVADAPTLATRYAVPGLRGGAAYRWARPVEATGREFLGCLLVAEPKAKGDDRLIEVDVPSEFRLLHREHRDGVVEVSGRDLQPGDVLVAEGQYRGAVVSTVGPVRGETRWPDATPTDYVPVEFESSARATLLADYSFRVVRSAA